MNYSRINAVVKSALLIAGIECWLVPKLGNEPLSLASLGWDVAFSPRLIWIAFVLRYILSFIAFWLWEGPFVRFNNWWVGLTWSFLLGLKKTYVIIIILFITMTFTTSSMGR